jgi:opacity protein-like surface antigen
MSTRPVLLLFSLAAATSTTPAAAQGFYWTITYEPSVPVGGIREATDNVSFAGAALGAKYLFSRYWSIGLSGHWNQFSQRYSYKTYVIADGAFTGSAFRQVWTGSALLDLQVYLAPGAPINPYLGVGGGVTWLSNQVLVSDLTFRESGQGVSVSPEAGILIAFDRDPFEKDEFAMQSIMIGARFTLSAAKARDVTDTSFIGLTLGLFAY